MIPRNFSHHLVLASSLAFVALASAIPMRTDALATHLSQGSNWTAYCSSELGGHAVYISKIFDVVAPPRMSGIDTSPLNNAFRNYLVEEYDFKSSSHYSAGCSVSQTRSESEAKRRQVIIQAQQVNNQIMEVTWNPGPLVAEQRGDGFLIGPKGGLRAHTFCAVGHDDTMYFSDIFETALNQNYKAVGDAFNDYLRKQYGFEPQVDASCTPLNTVREATAVVKARIGGVRYNRRKAVETGWKFGSTDVASIKPRPRPTPKPDDDPEPVAQQRPAAQTAPPSPSIKDYAAKEGPQVLAYCQNDRLLSRIFDCYRVQRSVYNYRMEHGSSEPLASLFTQEKVNLAGAIGTGLGLWVRARATADKFDNRVTGCIEQKFNVSFYNKPYVSKMNEIYAASVAACKP